MASSAGSSRTVSRQYIADFVSKEQRLRASTGEGASHNITAVLILTEAPCSLLGKGSSRNWLAVSAWCMW